MKFHVYLSLSDFMYNGGAIEEGDKLVFPTDAMTGKRASMIYIHGPQEEWEKKEYKAWLQLGVLPRLEDANPARVVWCHD